MNNKLFFDTNILLDAAMSTRPGWAAATLILDEIAFSHAQGFIASTSLKDVYYILSKYADEPSARRFVLALLDAFEVIPVDAALCRIAATSNEPDFENGIIRACAESVPVNFIISRDEKAFHKSPIKHLSASDYVDLFCDIEAVNIGH